MTATKPKSPARALLITGTDTGVGKTIVGGALAAAWEAMGLAVGVYKPLESGCRSVRGKRIPADARFLKWAAACELDDDALCPYPFRAPVAPALAAEQEGVAVALTRIVSGFETLRQSHDVVIVEGAGGLLSPLWGNKTTADLAALLDIPMLVVAANRLGVINHTLLTFEVARARGRDVLGVVLNDVMPRSRKADVSRAMNAAVLAARLPCPLYESPFAKSLATLGPKDFTDANCRRLARMGRRFEPASLARAVLG